MRKKFLSLVLALCMVISLLPMTAFAAKLTSLTVSTAAKNTAESGKVMLTITSEGTPEENGALLYRLVTPSGSEKPAAPAEAEAAIAITGLTQTIGEETVTWSKYELTDSNTNLEIAATDGQYVLAVYVEPNGSDNTKYDILNGAVSASPVDDGVDDTIAVTGVTVTPKTLSLEVGKTGKLTAAVTPVDATNQKVTWASDKTAVATVSADGIVTAVAAGSATITATTEDGKKTDTCAVTVTAATPKTELTKEMFTVSETSEEFTGSPITKTISGKNGDTALVLDQDYTVEYENNTNVGTATITITGKGNYEGTVTVTFTITAKSIEGATVAPIENQTYTGSAISPATTVTLDGKALVAGTDYEVTWTNNENVGSATGTITAKGNYTGTITEGVGFTIVAAPITGVTISSDTNAGEAVAVGNTLTAAVSPAGATVTYEWYNGDAKIDGAESGTYTLATGDTSVTVKVTGTGNYTGEKESNAIVVGKMNLGDEHVTVAAGTYTYNGSAHTPEVTVQVGDDTLIKDTDYTVAYSNNTNAGDATVTVTGKGNYTGTATATFTIGQADANVSDEPVSVAVGAEKTVTVTTDGKVTATSADTDKVTVSVNGQTVTITGVAETVADTPVNVTISAAAGTNYKALADTTVAVTVTAGSGETPGGNGGGSSGGSTTPTPPPVEPDPNPPSTGEDVTQTVTPDVSEGTASATVDKETADKLVSDAVDNKSENVTVKVDVPADADVNEVKADIPASAVADLASKTNAALTVDTPVGNVTIPNKTLAQLGGTSGNVTVTAAVNEDNSVKVEVQANGSTVGALNGGMKVDLPVSQPTAGTVAVLVDAEGNETILPKSAVDGSEVAVLLENGSATIKFVDNAQSFADTDNHWAKNSIAFVSSRNLFQGMENSSFKADVPMNRAMLVTVLHRLESTPAASGGSFDDVPSDSYYATAAAWAAGKGIVTGDDSGFSGDRSVTREEMAVMLYRYVQTINGNKGTLGSYSGMGGANDVSGWASEAMRWAVGSGIIGGDNSGNLNPGSTATRGEVSQMLMNFVKLITK